MRLALLVAACLWAAPSSAATILVTTNADELNTDGDCSLREAVQAANTNAAVDACAAGSAMGDVIRLTAIAGQTIDLALGQVEVTDGVTIGDRIEPTIVTIDANDTGRIFRVDVAGSPELVELIGFVLRDGNGLLGGAVLVEDNENVAFVRVTFDSNTSAASGGAVRVGPGSHSFFACSFTDNSTTTGAVSDGGGALYNNGGTVSIGAGAFTGNTAIVGTASGGAVLNGFGGTMTVGTGTTFTGNRAARAGGAIGSSGILTVVGGTFTSNEAGDRGGAVHLMGPASATFTGGTAFTGNRAGMDGGAIWNPATGTLHMTGSQITGNTAAGPGANQGGGGVNNDGGFATFTACVIAGNAATGDAGSGGGVLQNGGQTTIASTTISDNTARGTGGGIEHRGGLLSLNDVTLSGNDAGPARGEGGGLHMAGAGTVTMNRGAVTGNTAVEGGGLWKSAAGTLTVVGTNITDNTATGAAADQGGGGVYNDGAGGTLAITGATITGNDASGLAGSGGGVFNNTGATTTVTNTAVSGNTAQRAGGGVEDNAGALLTLRNVTLSSNDAGTVPGNGGGLHLTGAGTAVVEGGAVSDNTARAGGGLWKSAAGALAVTGTSISNNTATGEAAGQGGGGVYNDGAGGALTLSDLTVDSNDATGEGGVAGAGGGLLNSAGGAAVVTNVRFSLNTARRAGGGVADAGGSLTITRSRFESNRAAGNSSADGGALHASGAGSVTIDSSAVRINEATGQGGGLWNSGDGAMTVTATTVSENRAPVGAGVFQSSGGAGVLTVERSLLTANVVNTSGGAGGGLFVSGPASGGPSVRVANSTLSGNTAATGGGAVVTGGTVVFESVTVARNTSQTTGGVLRTGGALTLTNSVLADNASQFLGTDCQGEVATSGANLFESSSCTVTGPAPLTGDPGLQPLADNGGPTLTHALLAGSPAADAGVTGLAVDQRGYLRTPTPSIGAFEFGGVPVADEPAGPAVDTPAAFALSGAAPNPFRGTTALRFTTATAGPVEVALFDALGRRVRTLYAGAPGGGTPVEIVVDGASLPPGVYVVRLISGASMTTQRLTVVR